MALAPTSRAIGAVTRALVERINLRTGIDVKVGRPEEHSDKGRFLNLFLYEISHDPHLKNFALDDGQKPPLWLVLKYILTAFNPNDPTNDSESDSPEAHEDLGLALRAIYEDDLLRLEGLDANTIVPALESNPEKLHVTFDESSAELLTKLMQSADEKLRLSIAFQVRPVMIASVEPPDYSLLVGIDYTTAPPVTTPKYVGLDVIPSLGVFISEIEPKGFEVGEEVTLKGTDLHLSGLSVRLGKIDLPVTMQRPDELRFKVDAAFINGATISAGSHPISVIQTLASGKKRSSNMVIGNLVPTLTAAHIVPPISVFATIEFTGVLLGNDTDDAVLAFYQNGRVVRMFDVLKLPPAPPPVPQTVRRLVMTADNLVPPATVVVPPGEYLMILRVNGQQAPLSPKINLV